MPRKPKFMKGEPLRNMPELIDALERHAWLYWNQKPMHWSALSNMSITTLRGALMRGRIRYAIPYSEPVEPVDADFDEVVQEGDL